MCGGFGGDDGEQADEEHLHEDGDDELDVDVFELVD